MIAGVKRLDGEYGYSLVEVMASIVILSIAIIPMVAMFDSGLKAASTSGDYDTARAFANKKMEQAKSLPYQEARNDFPRSGDGTPTTGTPPTITSATEVGLPNGFGYTVSKRQVRMAPGASADRMTMTPNSAGDTTDTGLVEVTIKVTWGNSKSYTTTGVVGKETS